ncbi:hypothetical protein ACFL2C_03570 [Patescibacteria group bacterium]
MLSTPHVAVGAALAVGVGNPIISVPLAFGSHYVLDMVPHWNPHLNTDLRKYGKVSNKNFLIVFVDTLIALLLSLTVAFAYAPNMYAVYAVLLTCFAAVLPDLVEAPHYFLKYKTKTITRYIKWQKSIQNDVSPFLGTVVQLVVIAVSLWIINI